MMLIKHKDGRVWSEGQLGEMVDSDHLPNTWGGSHDCSLSYEGGRWIVNYTLGATAINWYHLDPTKYTVIPSGCIERAEVEKMKSELYLLCVSMSDEPITEKFNEIASKYPTPTEGK